MSIQDETKIGRTHNLPSHMNERQAQHLFSKLRHEAPESEIVLRADPHRPANECYVIEVRLDTISGLSILDKVMFAAGSSPAPSRPGDNEERTWDASVQRA